jgi:aspartyl-tRNA(Asn)/glutamyl-tRNA(Gln) amidotransferase subunit A
VLNSTLLELSGLLAARKISSVELTRACVERIGRLNGALNAFISFDQDRALAAARRADERRQKNEPSVGPLTGIPIAHKDIFCTTGFRTTCGSRMLENYTSPYDAHVVEELERAGMPLVGKCNMDEFAMGSSNESSYFGPARNPWDQRLVPGGSSGGSAAAVAARHGAGGDRHRHRRLDPAARGAFRGERHQADLRRLLALRHGCLRFIAGPGGGARQVRRRSGARPHGHGGIR